MDTFEGKGAVVTGGASGIGLATARVLGSRGARVVLADVEAGLDFSDEDIRFVGADELLVRLAKGLALVTLLRRQGDAFSFDIDSHVDGSEPWTGTISGTITPDAITMDIHATGTIEGEACDTGALTLTLDGGS